MIVCDSLPEAGFDADGTFRAPLGKAGFHNWK
jgi:hypothetical protein